MGRAGGGGGGSFHSSGGSHSISHSSGSHHISSGGGMGHSRAGSGSSRSSFGSSGSSRSYSAGRSYSSGWGYVPQRNTSIGGEFARGVARGAGAGMGMNMTRRRGSSVYVDNRQAKRGGCGCGTALLIVMVLLILFVLFSSIANSTSSGGSYGGAYSSSAQTSAIVRNKLETGNAYINDCIDDQLGWFDNESKTETRLKDFWEETGVQPYIILKAYDSALSTDAEKEQWALDYYDEQFDTENIFLYVYFAERNADDDVGSMSYAMGTQTAYVMDSEAVEIFWNYLDRYWYSDLSTDDLFVKVFDETAQTIMYSAKADETKSNNRTKVLVYFAIAVIVAVIAFALYRSLKEKNRRAKEKAEEDERILNTPINDIADDTLTNKYAEMDTGNSSNHSTTTAGRS